VKKEARANIHFDGSVAVVFAVGGHRAREGFNPGSATRPSVNPKLACTAAFPAISRQAIEDGAGGVDSNFE
jgi:hypothetical protein